MGVRSGATEIDRNDGMTEQDQRSVIDATERLYMALNSMLAGDPEPLTEVYSHADDATYMPAQGGILVGWEQVFGDWSKQAAASHGRKDTAPRILGFPERERRVEDDRPPRR